MTDAELIAALRIALRRSTRVLQACATGIQEELDRGYALTYEPLAGQRWRNRWNSRLGEVESALDDAKRVDLPGPKE